MQHVFAMNLLTLIILTIANVGLASQLPELPTPWGRFAITLPKAGVFRDQFTFEQYNRKIKNHDQIGRWSFRLDETAYHEALYPSGIKLVVPSAYKDAHYNAELFDKPIPIMDYPWLNAVIGNVTGDFIYKLAKLYLLPPNYRPQARIILKNENLQIGSRGWGFWNGIKIPIERSEMAWFMYFKGYEGCELTRGEFSKDRDFKKQCLDGLWTITQRFGDRDPEMNKLDLHRFDPEQKHVYEIDWQANQVIFKVDSAVASVHQKKVPQRPMRMNVWVDGSIYDYVNFREYRLEFNEPTAIEISEIYIKHFGNGIQNRETE